MGWSTRQRLAAYLATLPLVAGCAGPRPGIGTLADATEMYLPGALPVHVAYTSGVALPASALARVDVRGIEDSPRLTVIAREVFAAHGITVTGNDADAPARIALLLAIGTLTDSANPCGVPLDRYLGGPAAAAQRYCVPLPGTGSGGTPLAAGDFGITNFVGSLTGSAWLAAVLGRAGDRAIEAALMPAKAQPDTSEFSDSQRAANDLAAKRPGTLILYADLFKPGTSTPAGSIQIEAGTHERRPDRDAAEEAARNAFAALAQVLAGTLRTTRQ